MDVDLRRLEVVHEERIAARIVALHRVDVGQVVLGDGVGEGPCDADPVDRLERDGPGGRDAAADGQGGRIVGVVAVGAGL